MANKKSLKVGFILDTSLDPNDGVQQYVITLGEWLRVQGHNVHYLVGETKERVLPNIHSLSRNIAVSFNGNRTTIPLPTSKRKLRSFLQDENFDILHVQTPHHPFMAQHLILAAPPQTAVIATFHILPYGTVSALGTKLLGKALRPSLKRVDKMLAVSAAAAKFAQDTFKTPAEVLPNVVDYGRFHKARPFPEYQDDKLTILFFGRLVARKGCDLLLQAIKQLQDEPDLPNFRLLVCGRGAEQEKLQNFVNQHRLSDIVQFTGFVSEADKPRYYASADISVFPSRGGESFGIVLLEAMASGKAAVLAGDNPGYRSVLHENEDLLFSTAQPEILAQKLKEFMLSKNQRASASAWGEKYTQQFDVPVVGRKLLDIYRDTLRKRYQP
jgi:phosphatidylinositol alpha-mannosyltransferase